MSSIVLDFSQYNKSNVKDWIFKDYHNPLAVLPGSSDIRVSKDYAAIENSISNIFLFSRGENIVFPNFGNSLYKYVYQPITAETVDAIRNEIMTIFRVWEPRVKVVTLDVIPVQDENVIYIQMVYTVPTINQDKTLTFNVGIRRGE